MTGKIKPKKIPYGISDYEKLRRENRYYIDKTGYIEKIEDSSDYLFFLRPRRFGKSLWLSLMECYYDIARKDQFEELFKGTYIYDNPTDERNKYFILKFNFSEVTSKIHDMEKSFDETIKLEGLRFIEKYSSYIGDKYKIIEKLETASSVLKHIVSFVGNKGKIYLLIDEYDNFTNTIISSSGHDRYTGINHVEGFYRHFFNVIKAGTTGTGAPISKLFITGVSPVTMDDVTIGFNIGDNISSAPAFNEMVGFTEEELREMLDYYREHNDIRDTTDNLIETMKGWYDNYLFTEYTKTTMYNADMALYFIKEYFKVNNIPKNMLDQNIRTDYKKLKYLVITDMEGKVKVNGNFEKLKIILEEGSITSDIVSSFPAHKVIDQNNFISLLYYFGLLTIKSGHRGRPLLTIPNEVIKQLYYEYIREGYRDTDIFRINLFDLGNLFDLMAYNGEWEKLFDYLCNEMNKQTSLRDYIQGEKSVQTFLRTYLNITNYYITKTELELNKGYCDILLVPNICQFPDIKYSYLIEIKYISLTDFNETLLNAKVKEAEDGLSKYESDENLKKFIGNTELIKIILVFSGVEIKYKGYLG